MIIKNTVYGERWGLLDPQVLKRTQCKPEFTDEEANKVIDLTQIDFTEVRKSMGSPNKDLTTTAVIEKNILIECKNRFLPAVVCRPGNEKNIKNACVYFHGGGFIGGSSSTLLNQCRLIAERAKCVVISPDYRLAPETPFPGSLNDALEIVEWTISNQKYLGFNNSQVFVAGDSAGGNLAVECGLLDNKHLIKQVISIYGALDLQKVEQTLYNWNYLFYQMNEKHRNYIHTRLNKIMYVNNLMKLLYVGNAKATDPLVSPVYSTNFVNMPPITMIEAEFDYFLPSNKYFVKLLQQNNVEVQEILYKGLDHGFFDRLGYLKQSEETCVDIATIIQNR